MKHPPQGLPVSTRRQSVTVQSFTEGTQNFLRGIETKGLSKIWEGANKVYANKVYHVRQTNDSFS